VTATTWGLFVATFVASFVEMVEAATIVMAMGFTRSWRSALSGVGAALAVLGIVAAALGYTLRTWIPESALQLVIGTLLLIFGLQWLRKATLRASGRKSIHDEDAIYSKEVEAAGSVGPQAGLFDMFSFIVSFKGVFLEGMEVVFIVITFGLNAKNVPTACVGAGAAVVVVLALAIALRRPLSMINENLLKYCVGLLLASFGTFWSIEGIGLFRSGHRSLSWPGSEAAILALLVAWYLLSQAFTVGLRRGRELSSVEQGATA
jgi:uncharacterized membrane protein